ncbi:MAG: hypothetical protein NT040_15745 [Bacteroidetes bacterium]|nr:hypothetical protein [Bacteroidota bacterium]
MEKHGNRMEKHGNRMEKHGKPMEKDGVKIFLPPHFVMITTYKSWMIYFHVSDRMVGGIATPTALKTSAHIHKRWCRHCRPELHLQPYGLNPAGDLWYIMKTTKADFNWSNWQTVSEIPHATHRKPVK